MNKITLSLCTVLTALALSACNGGDKPAAANVAASDNAAASQAATNLEPKQQIKEREKNMKAMGKASKQLRAFAEGKEDFDAAKMQEAVALLNTHANQGWEYFDAVTKDLESNSLPAVWEKNEQFQQQIKTFQENVAALNTAAAQGTLDAIKAPLGKVGESCKACHQDFKKED